eukprot:jgi/Galph1/5812/GphlegSOOS_G4441.1
MEKLLQVFPTDLEFRLELSKPLVQTLKLKNIAEEPLAFKVKTTNPKRYFVKPNAAMLPVGKEIQVSIVLQPLQELPVDLYTCRDKFLLQAVKLGKDTNVDIQELWKNVTADQLYQQKFRVIFVTSENSEAGDLQTKRSNQSVLSDKSSKEEMSANVVGERNHSGSEESDKQEGQHSPKDLKTTEIGNTKLQGQSTNTEEETKTTKISTPSNDMLDNNTLSMEEKYHLALERISVLMREKNAYEAELAKLRSSLDEETTKQTSGSEQVDEKKKEKNKMLLTIPQVVVLLLISFLLGKVS